MRVFLRRHGWWCPWGVNCIDIIVTEKRRVAYHRRKEIRAFQAGVTWLVLYIRMQLHTVCWHDSPLFLFFKENNKKTNSKATLFVTRYFFFFYVLELRGVCGVCGEAGSGLRGLDRDETPWNGVRMPRRSTICKLLGLCTFSGGVWIQVESKDIHVKEKWSYSQFTAIKQKYIIRMKYKVS